MVTQTFMMLVWWKSFSPCHSFSVQMNSCLIVKARAYTDIVKMQSCKNKDPQHSLLDKNGISDSAHVYIIFLPTQTRGLGPLKGIMGSHLGYVLLFNLGLHSLKLQICFFFLNFVIKSCVCRHLAVAQFPCTSTAELSAPHLISAGGGISFSFFLLVLFAVSYLMSFQGLFYVLVGFAINHALLVSQYFINKLTLRSSKRPLFLCL